MGFFKKRETQPVAETKEIIVDSGVISDPLLKAVLDNSQVTRDSIMNIPSVSACINKIADTAATIRIKLYKKEKDKVVEVKDDPRLYLLNEETGDTLDAVQFKKAMITDMYLSRGGYAYLNRVGTQIMSIHYVEASKVGFQANTDPIFKDYKIQVNGRYYERFDFIKLLRNTTDGMMGKSIIEESSTLLTMMYASLLYEQNLVKTGGNKKGFIQATSRLTKEAIAALKAAFRNLYSNNTENVVVLNEGLSFKESSNTSVELQLNENKKTNSQEICKLFLIPPSIITGNATEDDRKSFKEECIIPLLARFETAINSVMLDEDEKGTYLFVFDTDDLLKGDTEKRFRAYQIALDSGFMQLDEVRNKEKLPAYGLDFIKLGLQDVLYYPDTNQVYTPNTNKLSVMGEAPSIDSPDPKEPEEEKSKEEGGEEEDDES